MKVVINPQKTVLKFFRVSITMEFNADFALLRRARVRCNERAKALARALRSRRRYHIILVASS